MANIITITPVKTPKEGAVFLSTNSLIIELGVVDNYNGDFYLLAEVALSSGEIINQIWSKYTETNIGMDLQNLFTNYFNWSFVKVGSTGLLFKPELKKTVEITLIAKNTDNDDEVPFIIPEEEESNWIWNYKLPSFSVLSSVNKKEFNSDTSIQKLSVLPDITYMSRQGVLRVPLFIKEGILQVSAISSTITLVDEYIEVSQKGIYEYDLNLNDFTNLENFVTLTFTLNGNRVEQHIRFVDIYMYNVEKLYVKNNFNIYEYIELFGQQSTKMNYKRTSFTDDDDVVHEVSLQKSRKTTINAQHLLPVQLPLLDVINESKEVYYEFNGSFLPFRPITKSKSESDSSKDFFREKVELEQTDFNVSKDDYNYDIS